MPETIKDLRKYYSALDLQDLKFLEWKAKGIKDNYRLQAINYARDDKSIDSEKAIQELENRYYGDNITLEQYDKFGDINDD